MVPEVGRDAISEVRRSIDAMAELTRRVIANGAETVILISPHAPLEPDSFVAYQGPRVRGNFSSFRAPGVELDAPVDQELLVAISARGSESNYTVVELNEPLCSTTAPRCRSTFSTDTGGRGAVVGLVTPFYPTKTT